MPILLIETSQLEAEVNSAVAAIELTVDFSDVPTAVTVTIVRTDPGGAQFVVRGADRTALSSGRFFVVDTEAPLGVQVSYIATGHTTLGPVVVTSNAVTVTIPIAPGQAWIKDPGRPGTAMSPKVVTLPDVSRDIRRGIYHPVGAKYPVVRSDVRDSETGQMVLRTHDVDETAALDFLFDAGSVLLFQADPEYGIVPFYFSAGTVKNSRFDPVNGRDPWRIFSIDYIKVLAPVGGSGGLVDWSDLIAGYDTWQDAIDAHSNWLSVVTGGY